MWPKKYKDYPEDEDLIHEKVVSGKGIVGCEMHEMNGWGDSFHRKKKKKGAVSQFLIDFFGGQKEISND